MVSIDSAEVRLFSMVAIKHEQVVDNKMTFDVARGYKVGVWRAGLRLCSMMSQVWLSRGGGSRPAALHD
jgi:hypothetical protein